MPQFNLLLLPLIGGFVFVTRWNRSRFHIQRSDGYRLVFWSILAGICFLFFSSVLCAVFEPTPMGTWLNGTWRSIVQVPDTGRVTLAFLLGLTSWWPLNLVYQYALEYTEDSAVDAAIRRKNDPLEVLFREALGKGGRLMVSTRGGKVYIGFVTTNMNPAERMESIAIQLEASGYRDKDTQDFCKRLDYRDAYKRLSEELEIEMEQAAREVARELDDDSEESYEKLLAHRLPVSEASRADLREELLKFQIVIPVSEIQSVRLFDWKVFDRYFLARTPPSPPVDTAT